MQNHTTWTVNKVKNLGIQINILSFRESLSFLQISAITMTHFYLSKALPTQFLFCKLF